MSNLAISARTAGAAQAAPTGATAERAYRAAVKALEKAQRTLAQDVAKGADERLVQADTMAVTVAAAAVTAAAAALAQETQRADETTSERTRPAHGATTTAPTTATASLDVYA